MGVMLMSSYVTLGIRLYVGRWAVPKMVIGCDMVTVIDVRSSDIDCVSVRDLGYASLIFYVNKGLIV